MSSLNPYLAVDQARQEGLLKPCPDASGRIHTLNGHGPVSSSLDATSRAFVEFASQPHHKVLEIGGAYGLACLASLKRGATDYTVNDLDLRHLKILAQAVHQTHPSYLSALQLVQGEFPYDVPFINELFDAILIARVLHFMHPDVIQDALLKLYKLLKPGGWLYAVVVSPYVRIYQPFIQEFEKRIRQKHPNPGYVEHLLPWTNMDILPRDYEENLNRPFLFFNDATAKSFFEQVGFRVISSIHTPLTFTSDVWSLDGRENVGIIAYRP